MATIKTATPKAPPTQNILGADIEIAYKDVQFDRTESGLITVPQEMTYREAIFWLSTKVLEEEKNVAVNERVEGFPIDVAYALQLAALEMYGIRDLKITPNFWGDIPPTFITVPTDAAGGTVEVFLGRFSLPGINGVLQTQREYNDALWIKGEIQQKYMPKLKELIALTRRKLVTHSLYKGKAIEVQMTTETAGFTEVATMANPTFMDLNSAPAELMLNDETESLLNAVLWGPIELSDAMRRRKISLKRSALLYGIYGTGKSLCALETAALAQKHGWTFVYLKSVMDLRRVYNVALRYSPVVIFAEDVDLIVKHDREQENEDGINMVNNLLDGLVNKTAEVMVVLTTNHVDLLPVSLLRFGRFDAAIEFHLPDRETAARLVRQYAGHDLDLDNFDAVAVGDALAEQQPSTIHEAVRRTKLFAQRRYATNHDGPLNITTEDLLLAVKSMRPQLRLLAKPTGPNPETVRAVASIVRGWADTSSEIAGFVQNMQEEEVSVA